ncbi:MAG: hypothetical protein JXA97_08550 [Anaerolineales bacterium]|nr:hypothetical protein [Anaerolineales bacterium]
MRELMNGAEAISRAALDAGCDFFAGYPITPATPILIDMVRELPLLGGTAIQAEDEIAAIGMCIGAAMGGKRVLTATSGPGMSLYSENIGLAIMGEVPMVIIDCQRMGPATGAATTTSQGDIQFLRWGTSGGFPLIVLAPADVEDCYSCTRRAFMLAERYRVPVIVATDKETVSAYATVKIESLQAETVPPRKMLRSEAAFRIFNPKTPTEVLPLADMSTHIIRFNTSSHDPAGYLTKDPTQLTELNSHLEMKISNQREALEWHAYEQDQGARTLLISYGISTGSMLEAARILRKEGRPIATLALKSIWPVPETILRISLELAETILVIEMNNGQYRREIERLCRTDQVVHGVCSLSGELISPDDILIEGGLR